MKVKELIEKLQELDQNKEIEFKDKYCMIDRKIYEIEEVKRVVPTPNYHIESFYRIK